MNNISQLPMRLTIFACTGILLFAFVASSESFEIVISILTLSLIAMLLGEDFGEEMKLWLLLALGSYGLGVIADLLDEIPELDNHWLLNKTDDAFMQIGVFLMCFCFIKMLHQRRTLIDDLNTQIAKARTLGRELSRQALHDDLTGLQNRRALFRQFDKMAINLQHGILAYIDLDNFKQVNDSYGHKHGDELLVTIARQLIRTAPKGSQIFRIGGDEFVVLMPSEDQSFYHEWIDKLYETTTDTRASFNIDISIGLAPYYPGNLSDPDIILARADRAMYKEKITRNQQSRSDNSYK
ncbi:GGDEF domain-containing protein [Photobacterium lipolyticum]|uniref:diguanylate cyclase n=1 Tax=Photobacterium lipolyticum TaxID=266810 RepID=A0A2T3MZW5_9GAMM|nr:GGDEF domain-containing protein [Photobacterium lipolyticum]PSW05489.1 GGDEF domain-containing protein [Photobacterium lipolyticum]